MADPGYSRRVSSSVRRRRTAWPWASRLSHFFFRPSCRSRRSTRLSADGDIGGRRHRRRSSRPSARRAGRKLPPRRLWRRPRPGRSRGGPYATGAAICGDDGCALGMAVLVVFIPLAPRVLAHVGSPEWRRWRSLESVSSYRCHTRSCQGPVHGGARTGARDGRARSVRPKPDHVRTTLTIGWPGTAASSARHFCGGARRSP